MGNNWPILVSAVLIAAAVSYGVIRQGELEAASKVTQVVHPLPERYEVRASALAPKLIVSTLDSAKADSVAPILKPALAAPRVPVAPIANVPGVVDPNLPPFSPGTDFGAALTGVRNALVQRFNVKPTPTAAVALQLNGVRVDIESGANWAVVLYNTNPTPGGAQNDTFKQAEGIIAGQLGIDLTTPPTFTADNKPIQKTQSKLGRVSITTDPATQNSVTIKPIQKRALTPVTPGTAAAPANPGRPMTIPAPVVQKPVQAQVKPGKPVVPVTPPKAPGGDQF